MRACIEHESDILLHNVENSEALCRFNLRTNLSDFYIRYFKAFGIQNNAMVATNYTIEMRKWRNKDNETKQKMVEMKKKYNLRVYKKRTSARESTVVWIEISG